MGASAVFVGLFLAGVGVVPVAMLAALFEGSWDLFWDLVVGLVLTFGSRAYGTYLLNKSDELASRAQGGNQGV